MIPTVEEGKELVTEFGVYEVCVFCENQTRFWHVKTNNPVCKDCAKKHKVAELYNWRANK